jgi:hypothetical protein
MNTIWAQREHVVNRDNVLAFVWYHQYELSKKTLHEKTQRLGNGKEHEMDIPIASAFTRAALDEGRIK